MSFKSALVVTLVGLAGVNALGQVKVDMPAAASIVGAESSSAATPLRGGCVAGTGCDSVKIVGQNGFGSSDSIEDAVKPVADWLKEFKKREGVAGDIYAAAEVSAQPLLMKLKRQQDAAIEALKRSNEQILDHVKRETIQHMVKLLSKEEAAEIKDEKKVEAKLAAEQAKDDVKLAKEQAAVESSLAAAKF